MAKASSLSSFSSVPVTPLTFASLTVPSLSLCIQHVSASLMLQLFPLPSSQLISWPGALVKYW